MTIVEPVERFDQLMIIAIAADELSLQAMQARLALPRIRFAGLRFGNLNTPDDLRLAGYADD